MNTKRQANTLDLLEKIRPSLLTVKAKNNITRITSKLFKALENEASMEASAANSDTFLFMHTTHNYHKKANKKNKPKDSIS